MPDDILDHPLISERYFFPHPGGVPSPLLVDAGDAKLACSFHPSLPGAVTVVHFHGNGEIAADWLDVLPRRFSQIGMGVLLAEYRGYGGSTGQPLLGKMLDDVVPVMRAAGVPSSRIIVFGRSVGSIFALEAVARFPDVAALVLESAIASPHERLLMRLEPSELGVTPEAFAAACTARLDHEKKMRGYRGPSLVMHCMDDTLVPVDNAKRLASWAEGRAMLRLFERGDHNTILAENEEEYFQAIEILVGWGQRPPR